MLLVAGIFSELNGLYPTAAGIRLYLGRAVGNRTALSLTFTYMTTVVLVIAADAFLIGAAVRHVLHEPSALAYVWIVVLLGLALAANLRGVRLAGWVQTLVTYTVLSGTAMLSRDRPLPRRRQLPPARSTCSARARSPGIQAVAFALFLYAAFEWVTTTAEEARTPRVITRALFIAPVLIWIVATLFALALTHLVPFSVIHHSAYPQLLLGRAALGTVGELWMLALTVLTALNTFNGGFLVASRFIYAAAREGNLPRAVRAAEPEGRPVARGQHPRGRLRARRRGGVRHRAVAAARRGRRGDRVRHLRARLAQPADPAPQRDARAPVPPASPAVRWRASAWSLFTVLFLATGLLGPQEREPLLAGAVRGDRRARGALDRLRAAVRAAAAGGGGGTRGRQPAEAQAAAAGAGSPGCGVRAARRAVGRQLSGAGRIFAGCGDVGSAVEPPKRETGREP